MTPKLGGQREKDAKVIELSLEDTFVRGSHLLTNMANIVWLLINLWTTENGIVKLKIVIGVDPGDSRFEQTLVCFLQM